MLEVKVDSPIEVLRIILLSTFNVTVELVHTKSNTNNQDKINELIAEYVHGMKKNLEALNNYNTNENKDVPEKEPFFQVFDGDINTFLKDLLGKKIDIPPTPDIPDAPEPDDMGYQQEK